MAIETAARLAEARLLYTQGRTALEQEDYDHAGELITLAAEMGESSAQCQLGYLYENGFFGDPDEAEAVCWYRRSAGQLLPNGQFRLAACYQLGMGVEQDYGEAARLFELAARQGHADAAEALRMLREMGVEPAAPKPAPPEPEIPTMPRLPADLDDPAVVDAVAAYQAEALQNNAPAQLKLGLAYQLGRNAPADPKLACFWVLSAMLAGDHRAAPYLQYCMRAVPPGDYGAIQSKIFMWMPGQPVPHL